jgi:hypothetical protein
VEEEEEEDYGAKRVEGGRDGVETSGRGRREAATSSTTFLGIFS